MATQWNQTFEGKHARETWHHVSGRVLVSDRSASWTERTPARPYQVLVKTPAGFWVSARYLGLTLYATAVAAMACVDAAIKTGKIKVDEP